MKSNGVNTETIGACFWFRSTSALVSFDLNLVSQLKEFCYVTCREVGYAADGVCRRSTCDSSRLLEFFFLPPSSRRSLDDQYCESDQVEGDFV